MNNRIACHAPSKYVNRPNEDRDKWPARVNALTNSGFHKMWYVSWPAKELVASRLELHSMQLASYAMQIWVNCLQYFISVHRQTESWRQFLHGIHIFVLLSANCCVNDVAYLSITYYQHFRRATAVLPTWQALQSIV